MSDAKVKFFGLGYEPTDGAPAEFGFACPKHKGRRCEGLIIREGPHSANHGLKHDPNGKNGGVAQWAWDGNRERPTFTPSVNCGGCWHGSIRSGRCVSTSGADEPEPS